MSSYNNLRSFSNSSPEQRLAILRIEMIPLITAIRGYASVIKQTVQAGDEVYKIYSSYADKIIECAENLEALRQELTKNVSE